MWNIKSIFIEARLTPTTSYRKESKHFTTLASHVPGIPFCPGCPFSPCDPLSPGDPFSPSVKQKILKINYNSVRWRSFQLNVKIKLTLTLVLLYFTVIWNKLKNTPLCQPIRNQTELTCESLTCVSLHLAYLGEFALSSDQLIVLFTFKVLILVFVSSYLTESQSIKWMTLFSHQGFTFTRAVL